jgi:lysophospholipase L1-like esterase
MSRPTYKKSRGPNGTRVAKLTAYPDDAGLVTTTIKPSGGLAFGLKLYTSKDLQDGWDIVNARAGESGWGLVLMEDGALHGQGGGSNDTPALLNVGGVRKNRILFWPKSGWGGVQIANSSAKITNPRGWTLGGIRGGSEHQFGFLIVSSENFGIWRSTAQYWNSNGASGEVSDACDFTECVKPRSWVWETDSAAVRGSSKTEARPTPGPITGTNWYGCYIAPTWLPEGSTAHTDALQYSGDSAYGGSTIEDTVIFAATHHGIIIGGAATDMTIRNTAVIGGQVNLKRFPVTGVAPADSKFAGKGPRAYNDPYVLNGTGAAGELAIYDSLFIGRMTNLQMLREPGGIVSNVQITAQSAYDLDKRFTLKPELANWTAADLDREFPVPTDAYLARIWAVDAVFVPDPGNGDPGTGDPGDGNPQPPAPAGLLTQDVMPTREQAFAQGVRPTLTVATAATVSGGVSASPTDATRVKYTGAAARGVVAAATSGYYRPEYLQDISGAGSSTNPRFMPAYGSRIRTASKVVEIALQQRPDLVGAGVSTRTPIRLLVDGLWTERLPIFLATDGNVGTDVAQPSFIPPGTKFWVRLEFPDATLRTIELQSMLELAGWSIPAGGTFAEPPAALHTILWDMDSLAGGEKHGTANYSLQTSTGGKFQRATYSHLTSLAWYASQRLGYDSIVNSSAGSSGYNISGDTVKFLTEARNLYDVGAHNPQVIVVGCGFNDVAAGQTASQLQANAITTLNQIKAAAPTAIIVVIALPSIPAANQLGGAAGLRPFNLALQAAARTAGAWLIDPIQGDLFGPTGTLVADKANMVTGNEAYISSDGTHPTQAGAEFFGAGFVGDMLRLVHPPVGSGTVTPPPASTDAPTCVWVTDETTPLKGTASLIVDAGPASLIESVKFAVIVGGKAVALPAATKGAGSNYVLTFDTTAVANSSYVVVATARGVNGKSTASSRTFTVNNTAEAPNVAPVVTLLQPAADVVLPRSGPVVFRGRATDDKLVGESGFQLRRIDGSYGPVIPAEPAVTGNGVYELVLDAADLAGLYDGAKFVATDTGTPPLTSETAPLALAFADVVDTTPSSDFTLTVTSSPDRPGQLVFDWTRSIKGEQVISYRILIDGLEQSIKTTNNRLIFDGLVRGTTPSVQIVAVTEEGVRTLSNEVDDVTVPGFTGTVVVGKPTLGVTGVTANGAALIGGPPAVTEGIVGYELKRGDVIVKRAEAIEEFDYVYVELSPDSDYRYTFAAIGAEEKRSDLAVVTFRTGSKPLPVSPGWFETGPAAVSGGTGPVQGRVLVGYSSDIRTSDGQERTITLQAIDAIDGKFIDPTTARPWRGFRSPNPADYIIWIEEFYGPDERVTQRPRRFRFPSNATGTQVAYLDRIWLDESPVGTSLPEWAQGLDLKVATAEQAAIDAKGYADAAAASAEEAAESGQTITLTPSQDGLYTTLTIGD